MAVSPEQHRLLYRVAQAYYEEGLTQQQVAARFALSRPKVSRLLRRARDEGVVRIVVVPPVGGMTALERALEARYGLDEAVVVAVSDPADVPRVARELGPAAAECLLRALHGDEIVAITWGRTIHAMVEALPHREWPDVTIVQLSGGLGPPEGREHSAELARRAAQQLGAALRLMPAPGIVATAEAARALRADPRVAQVLALAAQADVAAVGLGIPAPDSLLLREGDLVGAEELATLRAAGAVGDVALRYLDAAGRAVDSPLEQRIIGLSLDMLRRIPRVIGAAGGEAKLDIIRAALQGGLLQALITDQLTAQRLLAEDDPPVKGG